MTSDPARHPDALPGDSGDTSPDSGDASDLDAVLAALGRRLARHRVALDLTQEALADAAGVSKRTVERLEAGHSTQLTNVLRLLAALDLLDGVLRALPADAPTPMEQLRANEGTAPRRRATGRRGDDARSSGDAPWTWDESP